MSNKKVKNKKNTITYDEDGGFLFMKNWSPILRWISILPAIIITIILVKFIALGTVLNMLGKESYLLSLYIGAIAAGLVYMTVIDVIASVAPKKRVLTAMISAVIFGVVIVISTFFSIQGIQSLEVESSLENHYFIVLAIAFVSNIAGLFLGISIVKNRQKKLLNNSIDIM